MSTRRTPLGARTAVPLLVVISLSAMACSGDDTSISLPGVDGAPAPAAPAAPTLPSTLPSSASGDAADPTIEAGDDPAADAVVDDPGGSGTEDAPSTASSTPPTSTLVESTAPSTTSPAEDDPFLRRGDEGPEVESMQRRLIALEYLAPGGDTGVFDGPTADALIDFQAQYGLIVDGIFGPQTDRALNAAAASVDAG